MLKYFENKRYFTIFILKTVSSFKCYTHEDNGTSSSSEDCDQNIGHCYFKQSEDEEFERKCANDDVVEYFGHHNLTENECIVCNQTEGCPYEKDEAFSLKYGDVHCLCDNNFCNGICEDKSEECKELTILEQEVENCTFKCETTWMECGALTHNVGYFSLVQPVIYVFMRGIGTIS